MVHPVLPSSSCCPHFWASAHILLYCVVYDRVSCPWVPQWRPRGDPCRPQDPPSLAGTPLRNLPSPRLLTKTISLALSLTKSSEALRAVSTWPLYSQDLVCICDVYFYLFTYLLTRRCVKGILTPILAKNPTFFQLLLHWYLTTLWDCGSHL